MTTRQDHRLKKLITGDYNWMTITSKNVERKRPELITQRPVWFFIMTNARPHTSGYPLNKKVMLSVWLGAVNGIRRIVLDLAPSDFHLFQVS